MVQGCLESREGSNQGAFGDFVGEVGYTVDIRPHLGLGYPGSLMVAQNVTLFYYLEYSLYKDQGVEGYYDASLISDYKIRYNLFMLAVLVTGVIAVVIPFIIR